ncbi:hypothetical protein NQ318_020038 [Aromia moschata]|uniref:Multidrug resistance-associated protein lethal(2)03659 n=1 Tax=Aromia moschata TaxID=1265417 RepID=A0AAV8ZB43_9CUCU|nr:hypothetical protein NQ318_020038 [Aromia moschata]
MRASDSEELWNDNPRKTANCLSAVTFWYSLRLFRQGSKGELDENDLTYPPRRAQVPISGNPSMGRVILKAFYVDIIKYGLVLLIVELGVRMLQPLFIGLFIRYFCAENKNSKERLRSPMFFARLYHFWSPDQSPIQKSEAYFFAGGVLACSLIVILAIHPYMMAALHIGMKVRIACCSLIYRKALRIKLSCLGGETVGNAVNLMSNDVNRFDIAPMFLHYLWIAPSRRREINILLQTSYIKGVIMSFIMFTVRSCVFLTVVSIVLSGVEITAENVFLIISYYQILRETMTVYFPQGIAMVAEAMVSVSRIQKFMMTEETVIGDPTPLDPSTKYKLRIVLDSERRPLKPNDTAHIGIVHGMAIYADEICLEDVNLEVEPGQLTAVVGPVGAGKTCLLNLILGELPLFSGRLEARGVLSFASQEPWLFAGSIRQNILFGREFELERYREVVKVCALTRDFLILPYGDRSIVGERGISLSGGQRARVNLARAVYKRADIYLLDDPLSAVDIHVGQQLFDNCIRTYLKDKVVILVTHQLQYLKRADQIIMLENGMIKGKGTYSEFLFSRNSPSSDCRWWGVESSFAHLMEEQVSASAAASEDNDVDRIIRAVSISSAAFNSMIDIEGLKKKPDVLGEMRTVGSVDSSVYKEYFKAGANWCFIIIMVCFFLLAQVCASISDFFLSKWVNLEELRNHYGTGEAMGVYDNLSQTTCIFMYAGTILSTMVVAITRSIIFFTICMRSSIKLHDEMFKRIICASMRFFNVNTSGRILNRFSKDMGAVDELLPYAFIDTVQFSLNLVGAIVIVSILDVYLLIPTSIMLVVFYFLRRIYLKTSRSVKRLEGITRSPVFAHLNATLQGLPTIRSNGAEQILVREFDKLQDVHSSAWFMFLYTSRAFGLWLDLICTLYIGVVTYSFVFVADGNVFRVLDFPGSDVGLAITQCIGLSGLIQWGMRQSAELENQMTSVERVLEFTRIELEPDLESTPDKKPPSAWPRHGKIEFVDTVMRYSPHEPPVLKNINVVVNPMEKDGCRQVLVDFGAVPTSPFKGQILVDNLDISVIGIHDLRRKVSIIPQEPVLFSGTLRYNLDPFNEYDDETIYATLIDVEVKTAMVHGPDCLNYMVLEGGSNISVGERQMVCLVRAILRNNKILVMDEATANVDSLTDKFIQKTIRLKFAHCTVLTIAHRLHTVMDSDKVLVMDAGNVMEFDHPHVLLQNSEGIFYDMVRNTGAAMADTLRTIAKESYAARQKPTASSA